MAGALISSPEYAYVLTCQGRARDLNKNFDGVEWMSPQQAFELATENTFWRQYVKLREIGPYSFGVKRAFMEAYNFLVNHDATGHSDIWFIHGPKVVGAKYDGNSAWSKTPVPERPVDPPLKKTDQSSSSSVNDPKKEDESSSSSDIHDPRHYEPRRNPKPSSECKCYAREYDLKCMCSNT